MDKHVIVGAGLVGSATALLLAEDDQSVSLVSGSGSDHPNIQMVAADASDRATMLREVSYQFEQPFVLDSSAATEMFGLEPTPLGEALTATLT